MVKIPALTEETRRNLTKQISKFGEEIKARIRQSRQDELRSIKRTFESDEISEDEKKRAEKQIDETTKKFTDLIDTMMKDKNSDIMKI